jgi:hypothetical protein
MRVVGGEESGAGSHRSFSGFSSDEERAILGDEVEIG